MAQPDYVPVSPSDRVREGSQLPPAKRWITDRPGEIADLRPPTGDSFGRPGPDQGYALRLAQRFAGDLKLEKGEHAEDAIAGCVSVALKRASIFGRAPVIYDLEIAFSLFGFLGNAPRDLVEWRKGYFEAAAHHYWEQREISDLIADDVLRLLPAQIKERVASDWRSVLSVSDD